MDLSSKSSLKLFFFPHGALRRPTIPLPLEHPSLASWIDQMNVIMTQHQGIGLAAPQMGLSYQFFIARPSEVEELVVFLNPHITTFSEEKVSGEEGCLSAPGMYSSVTRAGSVEVEYFDTKGKFLKAEFQGLMARIIQHEVDHLNSIMFFDHLASSTKRRLLKEYFQSLKHAKRRG